MMEDVEEENIEGQSCLTLFRKFGNRRTITGAPKIVGVGLLKNIPINSIILPWGKDKNCHNSL